MNYWKPLALVSMSSMVLTVGFQVAMANPAPTPAPTVEGKYPHIEAALAALQTAQTELGKAEHDWSGWRAKADAHTKEAIGDINIGLAEKQPH